MIVMPGLIDSDCQLASGEHDPRKTSKQTDRVALRKLTRMVRAGTLAMNAVVGPGLDGPTEKRALKLNHQLQTLHSNLISTLAIATGGHPDLEKLVRQERAQFVEFRMEGDGWTKQEAQRWRERSAQTGFLMKARASSLAACHDLPVEQVCFDGLASESEIEWAAAQFWWGWNGLWIFQDSRQP